MTPSQIVAPVFRCVCHFEFAQNGAKDPQCSGGRDASKGARANASPNQQWLQRVNRASDLHGVHHARKYNKQSYLQPTLDSLHQQVRTNLLPHGLFFLAFTSGTRAPQRRNEKPTFWQVLALWCRLLYANRPYQFVRGALRTVV